MELLKRLYIYIYETALYSPQHHRNSTILYGCEDYIGSIYKLTNLYFSFLNFIILFKVSFLKKVGRLNLIRFLRSPNMYINIYSFYLNGT